MLYAQFLLVCLIWGGSFMLMKKAYVAFSPVAIGSLRAALGAATLVLLWYILRRSLAWPVGWSRFAALCVPAAVGFAYPYVMQPYLIGRYQDSAYFGMMVALVPLITILVSVPMLGVWPRRRELVGVLLGLGCLAVLGHEGEVRGVGIGHVLLAATVPLAYAVSNTFIKQRLYDVPPMALTASALGLAAMIMLPANVAEAPLRGAVGGEMWLAVASLLVLGAIGSGVAMYMFYKLIQVRGPLFAGMVTYLVPLGALSLGWLDGERVTAGQVAAMLGIFASVAMVQWPVRAAGRAVAAAATQP